MKEQSKYRVVKEHVRTYDDSIIVGIGEKIAVGQRDNEWTSWFWCTNSQQESGWVPEEVLDIHCDGTATVNKEYNSIELTVSPGEKVMGFERVAGWVWCRNERHEEGWIPVTNVVADE